MARGLMKDMNQGLAEGRLVDFWKKEDHFECIHVNHIRDMCDQVGISFCSYHEYVLFLIWEFLFCFWGVTCMRVSQKCSYSKKY